MDGKDRVEAPLLPGGWRARLEVRSFGSAAVAGRRQADTRCSHDDPIFVCPRRGAQTVFRRLHLSLDPRIYRPRQEGTDAPLVCKVNACLECMLLREGCSLIDGETLWCWSVRNGWRRATTEAFLAEIDGEEARGASTTGHEEDGPQE